jgi:hypothetical protein
MEISIPKGYFNQTVKREYLFWGRALIREFLQNSIDARASVVKLSFDSHENSLLVVDDGHGMNEETIKESLLAFGGTNKRKGAIGGFGKAKELLFFAWEKYAIHSRNWFICGAGIEFKLRKTKTRYDGTRCRIWFHTKKEFDTAYIAATEFLPRNKLNISIHLDSSPVISLWGGARKIKDLKWCNIYSASGPSKDVSVRVNGLEMFKQYLSTAIPKQIIIELTTNHLEVLSANRDSFKLKYSRALQKVLSDLLINPISSTLNIEDAVEEIILGKSEIPLPSSLIEKSVYNGLKKPRKNVSPIKFNFNYHFIIRTKNIVEAEDFIRDPVALPLAKLWTSILFEIIVANRIQIESFYPGFIFDSKICGLCSGAKEKPSILINPVCSILKGCSNTAQLIDAMKDLAYHELAHIFDRKHDERFVSRMEVYRRTHRNWKAS